MTGITLHNKKFRKLIPSGMIRQAVSRIARQINRDFKGESPLFISVLNGSFLFTSDLLKKITCPCTVSFIKVASYSGTRQADKVTTLIGLNESLKGKKVILLEDIVDSGKTLTRVVKDLKGNSPEQIKIATFFFKPEAYRGRITLDYVGMEVPDEFLLGYGLDYNGLGRNLQDVYILDAGKQGKGNSH